MQLLPHILTDSKHIIGWEKFLSHGKVHEKTTPKANCAIFSLL